MPGISASPYLDELATAIKNKEVVYFFGAGASVSAPSGLPASNHLRKELAELLFPNSVIKSKAQFLKDMSHTLRFEVFFQSFTDVFRERTIELLDILTQGLPNFNHKHVALLASKKLSPAVITTNFDLLLERALTTKLVKFKSIYSNEGFKEFKPASPLFKVLKMHGSMKDQFGKGTPQSILISVNQVGRTVDSGKRQALKHILKNYHIVFIGYSGMDDFDLLPIILTTKSNKNIYWVNHIEGKSLTITISDNLKKLIGPVKETHHKILVSRKKSFLIEGATINYINEIQKRIASKPFTISKQKIRKDFSYIKKWKTIYNFEKYKYYVLGLLLNQAGSYKQAVECFEKITPSHPLYFNGLIFKANCLYHNSQTAQSRKLLNEILAQKSRLTKYIQSRALVQLGLLEAENNNFRKSRSYLLQALQLRALQPHDVSSLYNNLGISYLIEADLFLKTNQSKGKIKYRVSRCKYYFLKSYQIGKSTSGPLHIANVTDNIALAYILLKDYDHAKENQAKALDMYRSLFHYREEASCLDNIGIFYKELGQYPEALDYFLQAHALKIVHSTKRRIALTMHNIGDTYWLLGDKKEALKWLSDARDIFRNLKLPVYTIAVEKLIAEIKASK